MNRKTVQILSILAMALILVSCAGPEAKKEKYTAKAEAYMKESNWPKARVSLQNVLKIDPKDANAYFLFGQVEEKEQNWKNAFINYLKTVGLKPDHREALVQIGRYYLIARDYDQVEETADKLLRYYPGDPSAITLKSSLLSGRGERKEAISLAEESIKRYPAAPDLVSLLASLYFAEGKKLEGEKLLKRALETSPGNPILLDSYADLLAGRGDVQGAVNALQKIVEVEPKVFEHRLRLSRYYDNNHLTDKAEATLREAVRLDPENEQRRQVLADFFKTHQKFKEEEAVLTESVNKLPNSMKIRLALGEFYERQRDLPRARSVYEEIFKQNKSVASSEEAEARLAVIDLTEGKRELAEVRLNEILKKNPNSAVALLVKGKIAKGKGDFKEAVQDFRLVLRDQPERSDIQTLLGESYLLSGETALARETFDQALALNPALLEAKRGSIRLEVKEGHFKEAHNKIDTLLKENAGDLETLGTLLDLEVKEKNWPGAEKTLAQLRKNGGDIYAIEMAEGGLDRERKELEKAKTAYERAEMLHPDAPEPLFALIKIELNQGKKKEAKNRLEKVIAGHPENPFAHEMLGELFLVQKDEGGAEREFLKASELKPGWEKPWVDQATLKVAQKKAADALKILESGLKANPGSEELRLLEASTLETIGETDRAIKDYEAILHNNPKDLLAVNNLVMLLTDKKGDPQSLEKALSLTKDFEKSGLNPAFLDTLGWVYVKLGRGEDAVRVLRSAVVKAPKEPNLNYHLGMAYYRSGQLKEAKIYLTKAVQSGLPFAGVNDAREALTQIKG